MIDEIIPYTSSEKYQGISIPLTMDEKWILHLLFEDDKRSYIVGIWLSYDGKYHTKSLPELYKIKEGLRMYTRGLITKTHPTSFFEISDRTVNEVKEKSIRCKFIPDEKVFIDELEANAILQLWTDALKGHSIIKLIRSMSIFSVSTSYHTSGWSHEIERFARVQAELVQSDTLPQGLKNFMQKNVFSSNYGKEILQKYEDLKLKQGR
jgi:hypothetical protein